MSKRGFTLVEVLVSTAIFSIVMVVALGALLALSSAARKAQALSSTVNNLSFALDSMSRAIRTGSQYHCGTSGTITSPQDCAATPANYLAFQSSDGTNVAYCLASGQIFRDVQPAGTAPGTSCGSGTFLPLTSPEVTISTESFYVVGSTPGSPDNMQPKVTLLIGGYVPGPPTGTCTSGSACFNLQVTVTQRIYDI